MYLLRNLRFLFNVSNYSWKIQTWWSVDVKRKSPFHALNYVFSLKFPSFLFLWSSTFSLSLSPLCLCLSLPDQTFVDSSKYSTASSLQGLAFTWSMFLNCLFPQICWLIVTSTSMKLIFFFIPFSHHTSCSCAHPASALCLISATFPVFPNITLLFICV